jgi:hypothetical protein
MAAKVQTLPITPVLGRVETVDFGAVESSTYEGGFREVFGRGLERPAGGADTKTALGFSMSYDLL